MTTAMIGNAMMVVGGMLVFFGSAVLLPASTKEEENNNKIFVAIAFVGAVFLVFGWLLTPEK